MIDDVVCKDNMQFAFRLLNNPLNRRHALYFAETISSLSLIPVLILSQIGIKNKPYMCR